ncbi:uncharacterized protein LOC126768414 [Nymphalis io]|uniref:uncharacterized protein LOC126768414 n=1 Tax=Inachis io TaxID=171585 RepID=UPI002169AB26|nr:uncharacterized protein LOC126768414 [Nymphalis io]
MYAKIQLYTLSDEYNCVPLTENNKQKFKNERQFPNGSVLGTYTYKDKDGNPVHVKYFADDSSYSVELKSIRVFEGNSEQNDKQEEILSNIDQMETTTDMLKPDFFLSKANSMLAKNYYKNNTSNPYDVFNSNLKTKDKGHQKYDDEYEIFLENVLRPSDKFNKEKVRVYVDKNRRKIRNISNKYKPSALFNPF